MTILEDIRNNFHTNSLYEVLGVHIDSSVQEIKKAYLQMSLIYHPDKTSEESKKEELQKKFQILSEVYRILSDESKKAEYDFGIEQKSNRINEQPICDEVTLRDCSEEPGSYYYHCRCSGRFELHKNLIDPSTAQTFILSCDSCSNSVKIII